MNPRDILLYNTQTEKTKVSVYFQNGTFWLTQKAMAELFVVNRTLVTKHLKNIFEINELDKGSVGAKIAHTANDGKNYMSHEHIKQLNRIVSAYLDLAENNAQRGIAFNMQQ